MYNYINIYIYMYNMGPPNLHFLEVFMVSNLGFRWPKILLFMENGVSWYLYMHTHHFSKYHNRIWMFSSSPDPSRRKKRVFHPRRIFDCVLSRRYQRLEPQRVGI